MNWQNSQIVDRIKDKLDEFIDKPFFLLGDQTRAFEQEFSKYSEVSYCKTVANGTVALQLMIRSLDLKYGTKILVSSFCPIPTIMAILQEGFLPKFVDIDKNTLNISKDTLKRSLNSDCSAVIAIHIFGKLCPLDEISEFCLENNLQLIEDACQAIGSSHPNYKIGEFSKAAAMSFYPTKNLGSWGDAGAILTNDPDIAHQVACMRNYGLNEQFESEMLGGNYRMDDFQAMVLSEKMHFLAQEKELRTAVYNNYRSMLNQESLQLKQNEEKQNHHVISYLLDKSFDREKVRTLYREYNLRDSFHYEHPVFKFKALKKFACPNVTNTLEVCDRIINLPVYSMQDSFYEKLINLLRNRN